MHPPLHRSLALSLALCAMVLRALLPAGWMPNPSTDAGAAPFVICSIDGKHIGGKPLGEPAQERAHAPCAFSAMAPLAPPVPDIVALAAPAAVETIAQARANDRTAVLAFYSPQSARAPPAVS